VTLRRSTLWTKGWVCESVRNPEYASEGKKKNSSSLNYVWCAWDTERERNRDEFMADKLVVKFSVGRLIQMCTLETNAEREGKKICSTFTGRSKDNKDSERYCGSQGHMPFVVLSFLLSLSSCGSQDVLLSFSCCCCCLSRIAGACYRSAAVLSLRLSVWLTHYVVAENSYGQNKVWNLRSCWNIARYQELGRIHG